MNYEGNHIIRPPSEANSIILQVTTGCSHNKCTFCGTYKEIAFKIKSETAINSDLDFAAKYCRRQNRVFLADGDVLILPHKNLVLLLDKICKKLPWVNRISLYGNAKSIRQKTVAQLRELKKIKLHRIYLGLESGCDIILADINKGADAQEMIEAGQKVRQASLFLSVTALLGIGGRQYSSIHAEDTGKVLTQMNPNQIGLLTLMLLPNTTLFLAAQQGTFALPDQSGILVELRTIVENIHLERVQFQANHASNYLPINSRLCRDKEKVLKEIDMALAGKTALVPEYMRAL